MLRRFLALSGALAVIFVLVAPALGAARKSRLSVIAPATARVNRSVKLLFRGYAARPANELLIYLDDRACAATGATEGRRSEVHKPAVVKPLRKAFSAKLTVRRSVAGTHLVCGYLENQRTGQTYAHASARYVTH